MKRARKTPRMPDLDPEALAHSVDDGMIITRSALVVALDNWIILRALGEGEPFDAEATATAARDEIQRMVGEQRALSERTEAIRTTASRARGSARHGHDYRAADDTALALRTTAHATVADRLTALRDDEEFLAALVEDARRRAWADVGSAILSRIGSPVVEYAPDDEGREERLRELREVDLAGLRARTRATAQRYELDDTW